jgi:transcription termination/antitermination protein NusA
MNTALLSALHEIETDKGIPFETVKGVLEESPTRTRATSG